MPLQANVENVLSPDEEEMYQCLMDQTAQPKTSETLDLPGDAKRCHFAGGGCAGGCAGCVT